MSSSGEENELEQSMEQSSSESEENGEEIEDKDNTEDISNLILRGGKKFADIKIPENSPRLEYLRNLLIDHRESDVVSRLDETGDKIEFLDAFILMFLEKTNREGKIEENFEESEKFESTFRDFVIARTKDIDRVIQIFVENDSVEVSRKCLTCLVTFVNAFSTPNEKNFDQDDEEQSPKAITFWSFFAQHVESGDSSLMNKLVELCTPEIRVDNVDIHESSLFLLCNLELRKSEEKRQRTPYFNQLRGSILRNIRMNNSPRIQSYSITLLYIHLFSNSSRLEFVPVETYSNALEELINITIRIEPEELNEQRLYFTFRTKLFIMYLQYRLLILFYFSSGSRTSPVSDQSQRILQKIDEIRKSLQSHIGRSLTHEPNFFMDDEDPEAMKLRKMNVGLKNYHFERHYRIEVFSRLFGRDRNRNGWIHKVQTIDNAKMSYEFEMKYHDKKVYRRNQFPYHAGQPLPWFYYCTVIPLFCCFLPVIVFVLLSLILIIPCCIPIYLFCCSCLVFCYPDFFCFVGFLQFLGTCCPCLVHLCCYLQEIELRGYDMSDDFERSFFLYKAFGNPYLYCTCLVCCRYCCCLSCISPFFLFLMNMKKFFRFTKTNICFPCVFCVGGCCLPCFYPCLICYSWKIGCKFLRTFITANDVSLDDETRNKARKEHNELNRVWHFDVPDDDGRDWRDRLFLNTMTFFGRHQDRPDLLKITPGSREVYDRQNYDFFRYWKDEDFDVYVIGLEVPGFGVPQEDGIRVGEGEDVGTESSDESSDDEEENDEEDLDGRNEIIDPYVSSDSEDDD